MVLAGVKYLRCDALWYPAKKAAIRNYIEVPVRNGGAFCNWRRRFH
ncbi:hypothetical protein IQ25_00356 [Novosphingobium taihuense]|uniref:Uncharacterized protein n=1 Tax=Novosphingobium taihuense TaxID=260085 RepID=A0A7W7ESP4_9SPHN|nr:hypothetical protein [Novosphingobium taihuense]TWH88241.1 hypothetical protein IQ25_00356 [Novosphingobium taihuense]